MQYAACRMPHANEALLNSSFSTALGALKGTSSQIYRATESA